MRCPLRLPNKRQGVAAVELAVLLPFLVYLWLAVFDFCRVFYYSVVVDSCARDGALYGCIDQTHAKDDVGIKAAAVKDSSGVAIGTNQVTVTRDNNTTPTQLTVSVSYVFNTITPMPWAPNTVTLQRSCVIVVSADLPKNP